MSANQTISFLRQRFAEVGIHLDTRHGQNFLIDLNLQRLLVEASQPGPEDVVLEVGTGTGSLTALLAARAGAVVSVEIDHELHQLASEELIDFDNVTLLLQDALKNKNTIDARVLEAVEAKLAAEPGRRLKLVANLPYNIATPLISNLLLTATPPVSMTVTIQKEVADRLTAPPGVKDYGALSVFVQSQCSAETLRVLPPEVFWPRPKVHSAIVQIVADESRRARIPDLRFFHRFVRGIFLHRRKYLRSVLASAFKGELDKRATDEVLAELSLDGTARADQLDVTAMLALSEAVRRRIGSAESSQQAASFDA